MPESVLPSHGIENGRQVQVQFRICFSSEMLDERMNVLPADGLEHPRRDSIENT